MSRTTQEWAALLEGTTEGPWEVSRSKMLGVTGDEGDMDYLTDWEGEFSRAENAALAAAAPEAVAEVVRLRRELEELKRTVGSLTLSAELLAGDHPKHAEALCLAADEFKALHDTITNILDQEGN